MTRTIEIKGLDELQQAFDKLPDDAKEELARAMHKAVLAIQSEVNQYPPSTAANRPGRTGKDGRPMGFYERGQGWWYPILRRATLGASPKKSAGAMLKGRADNLFGGFGMGHAGVAGYKLRRTSETFGRSWTTQVTEYDAAIVGEVGTDTTYAPWLVDDERQAQRMAQIGWRTVGSALAEVDDTVQAIFDAAVEKILSDLTAT